MKEKYKNQHIVPQAYLNRFATKKNDKYIIGTRLTPTDKNNKIKLFTNSVESVAYLENYYDTLQQKDKKYWEHYLDENFDTLCGKPLSNIISIITLSSENSCVLSPESKSILSRIILSQVFRVPAYLNEQIKKSYGLVTSYKKEILSNLPNLDEKKKNLIKQISFDSDMRKNIILEGIFDKERFLKFCNILERKAWVVLYNDIRFKMPFVTSDNPVLFLDINGNKTQINKFGLLSQQMVALYPISPSILIGIYPPDIFWGALQEYDGKRFNIDDQRFIIDINTKIISQSLRHSFLPEPLFSEIKEYERTDKTLS